MRDPDDIIMYKAFVEKFRIHIFLNGLDVEFEQMRGEILSMDLSLDLKCTHAYVHHEANHQTLMTGEVTASDFMAMLARRNTPPIRQDNTITTLSSSMITFHSFDIRNK
ncbi:hypothetical protein DKX38_018468 [Salix brachista]|uniref:Uncharacterized protein n=1 Tax=Salix brachista TaxID=2182728 RepID=A0A5N5KNV7_9ROSI|nr:hypothetical protein DKX38_018468 [Salix brachista]